MVIGMKLPGKEALAMQKTLHETVTKLDALAVEVGRMEDRLFDVSPEDVSASRAHAVVQDLKQSLRNAHALTRQAQSCVGAMTNRKS